MKIFICAVITLCLLTGGITLFCIQLDKVCGSLLEEAESLETLILEKDRENAEARLSEMKNEWEKHTSLFMAFTEHGEINSVSDSLTDIGNSLLYNDFATAYRELSTFRHLVTCISSGATPSIINIL